MNFPGNRPPGQFAGPGAPPVGAMAGPPGGQLPALPVAIIPLLKFKDPSGAILSLTPGANPGEFILAPISAGAGGPPPPPAAGPPPGV